MPSLSDLLTIPTVDQILDSEVLAAMKGRGLQVTAWADLDPWRILSYMVATLRQSVRQAIATRTAAGIGEYVFGKTAVPGGLDVTSWAPVRARSWYGVEQFAATYTKRLITLTNSTAGAYGPLPQGKMIVQFPSGNRYVQDDDAVTIPGSGTGGGVVQVVFRSEFKTDTASGRDYSVDQPGSTITMVNAAFPGVVATNPATNYSSVAKSGSGLGTLTLGGSPSGSHSLAVRIDSAGQSGAASWSLSIDGGSFSSQGAVSGITNAGGYGINITLTNDGGGSSPSFLPDTVYYFSTPGTDVVQLGRDAETAQDLGARCYAIWPSLSFVKDSSGNWLPFAPVMSAVEALTRSVADEVAVVLVRTSTTINDEIRVLVAGQGGLVSSGTLALLQSFWATFAGLTDIVVVASPSTTAVTLGGATVKAKAAQLATAKVAAQRAVSAYLRGVDPNNRLLIGDGVAVIDRSYINSLIRSAAGVTHLDDGLTINGSATDLTLAVDHLATYAGDVGSSLTWVAS